MLETILSGDPDELDVHLKVVRRDVALDGCKVTLHCHCLTADANGRLRLGQLAEFMRDMVADYAIPKKKLAQARDRDLKFKSSGAVSRLHQEAIRLFTDLKNTGEGGEMLLYLLAERFLKMPLVLCKMDLKTDSAMHYHGADGVYTRVAADGVIKLYWGESKVFDNATDAIRECLSSLAPFLTEPDQQDASRERDLVLLSDKADLDDENLTNAFRAYFDRASPKSNRVKYCGVALVGFDADFYPADGSATITDELVRAADAVFSKWGKTVCNRISQEKLTAFDIEFLCIPLPSAESFRKTFLDALGIRHDPS